MVTTPAESTGRFADAACYRSDVGQIVDAPLVVSDHVDIRQRYHVGQPFHVVLPDPVDSHNEDRDGSQQGLVVAVGWRCQQSGSADLGQGIRAAVVVAADTSPVELTEEPETQGPVLASEPEDVAAD